MTFAAARAELTTAMAGIGNGATSRPGSIAPPYVLIAGDGAASDHIVRGAAMSTWRVVLCAGGWEADTTAGVLDAMKDEAIAALRELDGWQVGELGRDGIRTFAGSELLTAELRGVRMIDL